MGSQDGGISPEAALKDRISLLQVARDRGTRRTLGWGKRAEPPTRWPRTSRSNHEATLCVDPGVRRLHQRGSGLPGDASVSHWQPRRIAQLPCSEARTVMSPQSFHDFAITQHQLIRARQQLNPVLIELEEGRLLTPQRLRA